MRRRVLLGGALIVSVVSIATADEPKAMRDVDFLADWRDLKGQSVMIDSCAIGGTASDFIRCESRNGAASWTLDPVSMDRDDLKYAYDRCPTGSARKPECRFKVLGTVKNRAVPELSSAKFLK